MHKTLAKVIRVIGWNLLIICSLALSIYFYNFLTSNKSNNENNGIKEMFQEQTKTVKKH
jgi:uncharacterized protein YggT (Ycf19 family)